MVKGSISQFAQRGIVCLFHILILTLPFAFTWVNEELFEFPKMLLTYGITTGIIGLWVVRLVADQQLRLRRTIFDLPMAAFAISQLLSTLFSIHPYTSFFGYYTRFHGGLLSTLTYIALFYAFVHNINRKQLKGFWYSLLLAAAGVCLYAIPEHFGHSPSCYLISGTFDVSCWVQDVQNRVFGTFGQPNWLAAYTITLLPIALSLGVRSFVSSTSHHWKLQLNLQTMIGLGWLGLVIMLFSTLLFTQSRSGLAGLMGGLLVWILLTFWQVFRHRQQDQTTWPNQIKTLSLLGGVTLVTLFGVSQLIGKPFAPDFGQLFFRYLPQTEVVSPTPIPVADSESAPVVNRLDTGGTDSGQIRQIVWQGAWQVFLRYPLLGSGVETFAYSYYQDRPMSHNLVSEWDFLYNKAHNEFLNYLATTGIIGFSSYLLLLGWFGVSSLSAISRKKPTLSLPDRYLVTGLVSGVVGLSISNFFGFSTVMVTVVMYLFFAILVVITDTSQPTADSGAKLGTMQYLSLGGVALTGFYIWSMIWSWWSADTMFTRGKQYIQAGLTVDGMQYLQTAIIQSPQEALFYDELATTYSLVAATIQAEDATTAAEIANAAIVTSDQALTLNPRHLNFYKSRARIFINLSVLDPKYFEQAKETLDAAVLLAPTDAKLRYNLALVEQAMGRTDQARLVLEETVAMKANYGAARLELARRYREAGQIDQALQQYQYLLTNINSNNPVVVQELEELEKTATSSAK